MAVLPVAQYRKSASSRMGRRWARATGARWRRECHRDYIEAQLKAGVTARSTNPLGDGQAGLVVPAGLPDVPARLGQIHVGGR
jgi:hypothetical protein